jgi:hypothetical protein
MESNTIPLIKCDIFGFGFAITRYFTGGGWNERYYVPVTWCWQLALRWRWYNVWNEDMVKGWWWRERCFYSAYEHAPTEDQETQYRFWVKGIMER